MRISAKLTREAEAAFRDHLRWLPPGRHISEGWKYLTGFLETVFGIPYGEDCGPEADVQTRLLMVIEDLCNAGYLVPKCHQETGNDFTRTQKGSRHVG